MKPVHNFLLAFPLSIFLLFFSCQQPGSNNKMRENNNKSENIHSLTLDTFSTFPPEIDGCSCYFSNDSNDFKKNEYIYVNDFVSTSFLKINGIMTKFKETSHKNVNDRYLIAKYKSTNYEMTIEIKDGKQNGDETWLQSGTIQITDKKGNSITKKFYGECGC